MKKLKKIMIISMKFLFVITIIFGIVYPVVVTGVGQLFFAKQSNGSVISIENQDGVSKKYGSELLGQAFTKKEYLIGRPTEVGNYAPNSPEQRTLVEQRIQWWHTFSEDETTLIPADLVMASGSGVDPYITAEAAYYQVERIAKARNIAIKDVYDIIDTYKTQRLFGFIGETKVHVLSVNLALDGII